MNKTSRFWKDTGGSITALTVVALIAFVGVLAFVVDLGHLHIVQNELRNAADACALRGARAFLPDSVAPPGSTGLQTGWTGDQMNANATAQASSTVTVNKSDNVALKDLPSADIKTGIWYYLPSECPNSSDQLTNIPLSSSTWPPPISEWGKMIGPGIRLPVKRTGSDNYGPVAMSLAGFLGQDQVSVGANATAALSGMGGFVPGSPVLPFGTWSDQLTGTGQQIHGTFRNDNSDTLGWTNLDPNNTNPNASELMNLLADPTGASTPDCPTGSTVGIQNGVAASVVKAMVAKNNRFGLTAAGGSTYVPTGSYATKVYMMPVFQDQSSGSGGYSGDYGGGDCVVGGVVLDGVRYCCHGGGGGGGGDDKFNNSAVVGAVPVNIVQVQTSPNNTIDVKVVGGNYVAPGYGGGAWYGILSAQPFLVQ